jgi:uncharacterized Zn-binding protein involved in type VI secretion
VDVASEGKCAGRAFLSDSAIRHSSPGKKLGRNGTSSKRIVKTKTTTLAALAIALFFSLSLFAQTLTPVPPDDVPSYGTFFSSQNRPPMPIDWYPSLPVFSLGDDRFLIDDSSVDYSGHHHGSDGLPDGGTDLQTANGVTADDVPGLPGGGDGGSTNSGGEGGIQWNGAPFSTNGLWMQITGVTNGLAYLNLQNATDEVYEVWSTLALTNNPTTLSNTAWNIEQEVFGLTNQNWTPFTVAVGNRTNSLFFWARDWTGIDDNNNGIPDWWEWAYFGTLTLSSNTDYDGSGLTILQDYQQHIDPNIISFTPSVTNQYVNLYGAPVQLSVTAGVPFYYAILLDDPNTNDAAWTAYSSSNISASLGTTQGWHRVLIGLKGLPSYAQQTWSALRLNLDVTPPSLIVTNPVATLAVHPMIQLQGYSPEDLVSVSYDLNNAAGLVTNQSAYVTFRQFDSNNPNPLAFDFTTNYFQCFNVPLAIGANSITLHATDLAGNTTTTNVVYTYDPTSNTNPPVINLQWPLNGANIVGSNFNMTGTITDPFATISAQLVNDGVTNSVSGLVQQNGSFWIENAPLGSGTNYIFITATNAAGYGSATNFVVVQSPQVLAITSVSFNSFSPTATVTGTVSGANTTVLVNGFPATNNGDGTWTAQYAPAGQSSPAVFVADVAVEGSPSPSDPQVEQEAPQPSGVSLVEFEENGTEDTTGLISGVNVLDNLAYQMSINYGTPGSSLSSECVSDIYNPAYWRATETWDANGNSTATYGQSATCGELPGIGTNYGGVPWPELPDYCNDEATYSFNLGQSIYQRQAQSRFVLNTGGAPGSPSLSVWVVNTAMYNDGAPNFYPAFWLNPVTNWTVAGQRPDQQGNVYLLLPNNVQVDVTPKGNGVFGMLMSANQNFPAVEANGVALDPVLTNATFCVGQQVTFNLAFYQAGWPWPGFFNFTNQLCNWILPSGYVNTNWQQQEYEPNPVGYGGSYYPVGSTNYIIDQDLLRYTTPGSVSTSCWYTNGPGGTASVGANLQFPNGTSATIAAIGNFGIYRPTTKMTNIEEPRYFVISANTGLTCQLQLGTNDGSAHGCMNYSVEVDTTNGFYGNANITQLVTADYSNPIFVFSTEECDGSEFYNPTSARIFSSTPVIFSDGPSDIWDSPNIINISARDFVRFQPDGVNSIWVTLGIVTWDAVGIAEQDTFGNWSLTSGVSSDPSGPANSTEFPTWTQTVP